MEQFVADDFSVALTLDSLKESHPILQEVMNPDEISSLFDAISYQKVCMLIAYAAEPAMSVLYNLHRALVSFGC